MKKLLVVLLALALVFAFAACNEPAPVEEPPAEEGGEPAAEAPADTTPIRIGFFAPESAASAAADGQTVDCRLVRFFCNFK